MRRVMMMAAVGVCLLTACKTTKVVTVEKVRTDTLWQSHTIRDSVFAHDSIYIHEWMQGDTVWVEKVRWKTEWRNRIVYDTLYRARVDSVPVPYAVEKLIEKDLNWWQRTQMYAGDAALMLLGIVAVWGIVRIRRKLPFL